MGVPDKILPDKFIEKALYWGPLFVGVVSLVGGAVLVRVDLDFKTRGNSWVIEDQVMVAKTPGKRPEPDATKLQSEKKTARDAGEAEAEAAAREKRRAEEQAREAARQRQALAQQKAEAARREAALARKRRDEATRREIEERQAALQRAEKARRMAEAQRAAQKREAAEAQRLAELAARKAAEQRAALERKIVLGASERVGKRAGVEASFATHAVARGLRMMGPMVRRSYAGMLGKDLGGGAPGRAVQMRQGAALAASGGVRLRAIAVAEGLGRQGILAYNGDFGLKGLIGNFNARMFGVRAAVVVPEAGNGLLRAQEGGGRLQLAYLSATVGASPLLTQAGLANSLEGAVFLKNKNRMWALGERLSQQQYSFGQAGFGMLASRVRPALSRQKDVKEQDAVGAVARAEIAAAFGPLGKPLSDDEAFAGMNCSERFYSVMQRVKAERVARIKDIIKPITSYDKSLPGKWMFAMGRARKRTVCVRYKRYYSGRRKCIKRAVRYSKPQGGAFLSEAEESYITAARKLVAARGRDPMVKPRSASYWVINRVATDLGRFTGQPLHPAICTGVPRMVDYFDGNLTKIKKHVAKVHEQAAAGEALLKARVLHLEGQLTSDEAAEDFDDMRPRIIWQGPVNVDESRPFITLIRITEAVFGFEAARLVELESGFIPALARVKKMFAGKRSRFPGGSAEAFGGTMALLEASYYIRRSDGLYEGLSTHLFGSLGELRRAYERHCGCDGAMPSSR